MEGGEDDEAACGQRRGLLVSQQGAPSAPPAGAQHRDPQAARQQPCSRSLLPRHAARWPEPGAAAAVHAAGNAPPVLGAAVARTVGLTRRLGSLGPAVAAGVADPNHQRDLRSSASHQHAASGLEAPPAGARRRTSALLLASSSSALLAVRGTCHKGRTRHGSGHSSGGSSHGAGSGWSRGRLTRIADDQVLLWPEYWASPGQPSPGPVQATLRELRPMGAHQPGRTGGAGVQPGLMGSASELGARGGPLGSRADLAAAEAARGGSAALSHGLLAPVEAPPAAAAAPSGGHRGQGSAGRSSSLFSGWRRSWGAGWWRSGKSRGGGGGDGADERGGGLGGPCLQPAPTAAVAPARALGLGPGGSSHKVISDTAGSMWRAPQAAAAGRTSDMDWEVGAEAGGATAGGGGQPASRRAEPPGPLPSLLEEEGHNPNITIRWAWRAPQGQGKGNAKWVASQNIILISPVLLSAGGCRDPTAISCTIWLTHIPTYPHVAGFVNCQLAPLIRAAPPTYVLPGALFVVRPDLLSLATCPSGCSTHCPPLLTLCPNWLYCWQEAAARPRQHHCAGGRCGAWRTHRSRRRCCFRIWCPGLCSYKGRGASSLVE